MSNKILFVFEGRKTEKSVFDSLCNNLFNMNTHFIIECVFDAEIYQLYDKLQKDEYIETFEILKERDNEVLSQYKRSDFAEIYLFFDYDAHASTASNDKIKDLLAFFDNETEQGKLFISYPMVEAIKHTTYGEEFKDKVVSFNISDYKCLVNKEAVNNLKDFRKYDSNIWKLLLKQHLCKMNYIVNDVFEYPLSVISQEEIFICQYAKYIIPSSVVSVLSAFPLFIHYYFGNEKAKSFIF